MPEEFMVSPTEMIKSVITSRWPVRRVERSSIVRPSELTQQDNIDTFGIVLESIRRSKNDGLISETVITRFLEVNPSLRVCRLFLSRVLGQLYHTPERLKELELTEKSKNN